MSLELINDEARLEEKGRITNAYYNSAKTWMRDEAGNNIRPETVFIAKGGNKYAYPAFDMSVFRRNMFALKQGKTNDWGKVNEDPWLEDFAKLNNKKAEAIKSGNLKSAGYGEAADFSAIDVVNVQAEMVNTELRDFVLEQAVTTVATPQILLSIDTYTRFTGQKKVAEGVPPVLKLGSVSRSTFTVSKDGTAIGLTFEAQTRNVHDIYRTHVDNAISDLRRIKAGSIATEIETASDDSAGDWGVYTSDHFARIATDDIGTSSDTIVSNNGRPDTAACHDRVARDLMANMGAINFAGQEKQLNSLGGMFSSARVLQIPGTNITLYVDNAKTNTLFSLYDKRAIIKMQGPVRTAVIRDDLADIDMFRIFDFNLPKLIISGRARDITGVSA